MLMDLLSLLFLAGIAIAAMVGLGIGIQLLQQRDARKKGDGDPVHKHPEGGRPS